MERTEFMAHVFKTIEAHPDWLQDTLTMASGAAMGRMRQRIAEKDVAMMGALMLAKDGRLTKEVRDAVTENILPGLAPYDTASPIEKAMHDAARSATSNETGQEPK